MTDDRINFIQINLRKANKASIAFSDRFKTHNTHIGIISEPSVYKGRITGIDCGIKLYDNSCTDPPRAALVFRRDIKFLPLFQFVTRDLVAAEINCDLAGNHIKTVIASGYHDGNQDAVPQKLQELVEFCTREGKQLIYGCDANAHHEIWGSRSTKPRGQQLLNFLFSKDLNSVNFGNTATYYTIKKVGQQLKKQEDVIDLTLTTAHIYQRVLNWRVSDEPSLSDHRYIDFTLHASPPKPITYRNPRCTDWNKFRECLRSKLGKLNLNIRQPEALDKYVDNLTSTIQECFEKACPEKVLRTNTNNKWWNQDLDKMRKDLRKAQRKAKRSQNFDNYHKLLTDYSKAIIKAKKDSFRKTVSEEMNNISATARMQKLLSKDHTNNLGSLQKPDGSFTASEKETLSVLGEIHFPGSTATTSGVAQTYAHIDHTAINYVASISLFSQESVRWAVKSFKPYKSAGLDGILPVMLQEGLDLLLPSLRMVLIRSHAWNFIPTAWRKVNVIYIPKIGRNSGSPKSFRPISLSSFVLKAAERIVDRHIRESAMITSPLHLKQFAYQPGKSTVAALQALRKQITRTFEVKQFALGAFIDIAGAFDNTSFDAIAEALQTKGVDQGTAAWIAKMLESRIVTSTLGATKYTFNVTRGCPQGGVLSPLLWTLVVDDLITRLNNLGFYAQAYADDIVILCKGAFSNVVSDRMQAALNFISMWCQERGLSINPAKTELLLFTRNRKLRGPLRVLKLFGQELEYSSEVKYLGVIFDCKLNWNAHLKRVIDRATASLFTCKRMVGKMWGLDPKMVHWTYTAIVRPIVSYAALVWWGKSTTQDTQKKLNKVQRLACLMMLGCANSTPTAAMESLVDIPPLHLFLKYEAMNMNFRFRTSEIADLRSLTDDNLNSYDQEYEVLKHSFIDDCLKRYDFIKNYEVDIPDREDWFELDINEDADYWYTDGSKTLNGTGSGVYNIKTGEAVSKSLPNYATVFQAEIRAVNLCANQLLNDPTATDKTIYIQVDSKAALHALKSCEITSRLVHRTIIDLNRLAQYNRVKLRWIPAHEGYVGNEIADRLAQEGANANDQIDDPEPYVGMPWCMIKACMHKVIFDERQNYFLNLREQKHSKRFMQGLDNERAKQILSLGRNETRLAAAALTGHFPLNDYLFKIGVRTDNKCRYCNLDKENMEHLLCNCMAIERQRNKFLGNGVLDPSEFRSINVRQMVKFLKEIKI